MGGSVGAEAEERVFEHTLAGDDVHHRAAASVFGRGVLHHLDAVDAVGGEHLDVLFEGLAFKVRGAIVDPHGDAAAVEGDVALHIHLHARGVLEGVACVAGLYAGIFGHVVEVFLAVHGIERTFLGNGDHVEEHGPFVHDYGAHVNLAQAGRAAVAGVGHGYELCLVTHSGESQEGGDGVVFDRKKSLVVGCDTTEEGGIVGPHHGDVGKGDGLFVLVALQFACDQLLGRGGEGTEEKHYGYSVAENLFRGVQLSEHTHGCLLEFYIF